MRFGFVIAAAAALGLSAPGSAESFILTPSDLTLDAAGLLTYSPEILENEILSFGWNRTPASPGFITYDAMVVREVWGKQPDGTFKTYYEDGFYPPMTCPLVEGNNCSIQGVNIGEPHLDIVVGKNLVTITRRSNVVYGTCDLATAVDKAECRSGVLVYNLNSLVTFANDPNLTITGWRQSLDAVPEPSTWAMLIIGFGMAGSAGRIRSSRKRQLT